jgi:hypothetical protein
MGLAVNISAGGIVLSIERVEVLLQPLVGRNAGINGTANHLIVLGIHGPTSDLDLDRSRKPKNRGPFQRVPVIANATFDRLG